MSESASNPQINITLSFYSTLRNITGQSQISLQIPQKGKLINVIKMAEEKYFIPKNSRLLNREGTGLEAGIICLIDDADISLSGGLQQKLSSDTVVTLISSLHGG